ncbi:MAG: HlyD family efflux transporter periplasmic adaptor subunit, partial [Planctomycetales bacterium]|nr:HlyD family efflux transporter periplasmic adaptor subunit [Planctomycetales bacterium]NIM08115.1 HlyD family efflux transporter periplasmic adaptor subunit [Planctomycetales bacterium]NIN07610.1 HlyD family efflux transporter periplasmic adaptor subunit [Planctomycetales bacterium]NIN76732.1 HlyD family efflux transporter periplasmic adaptor subunit [Planctomycetales bacterium]NIO33921.1 HlyD family efflux transporter periplasmic adaptor subunit [Planctomycetales bacterium]
MEIVPVRRGSFLFTVTETGEVESASSLEIRCEVKARGAAGTTILEIIGEGSYVRQGDFLVRLDSSALELERNAQQIVVHSSEAAMIQARNAHKTAKIAKTEYLEGAFQQEELTIQGEIFVAQENVRRAEDYLQYSQRLAAKGYITNLQLEADRFSVDKARQELTAAESKLQVLRDYTKAKMLTQLESDIQSTYAQWQAATSNYQLDVDKLKDIEDQIARCTITAPADGQVQYANRRGFRGGGEVIIEPGTPVREGQAIIRLPDPTQMQVAAEIAEASTKYVRPGMPATIKIRSATGETLRGKVAKVNDYPEPGGWFSTSVKKYGTRVDILDNPGNLKPGLTAEVAIQVDARQDVLQLPLPAVLQHGSKYYCVLKTPNGWQRREVQVGLNNDQAIEIRQGLQRDDQVIANPRRHRQLVTWPALTEPALPREGTPVASQGRPPASAG